jgi:glucose-6-phosphate 1-dehydrogenase
MIDQKTDIGTIPETVVTGTALDDAPVAPGSCIIEGLLDPFTIIVFGASGDLTLRKLIPALYKLYLNGGLPASFAIVGCSRTEMGADAFRERLRSGVERHGGSGMDRWAAFAERVSYYAVQYDSLESLQGLASYLRTPELSLGPVTNRIFYMATPPAVFHQVGELIGLAGLTVENRNGQGWVRIVIEKPFSHDLESAVELNQILNRSFTEDQIYRIDHYVAKETVQNLLMFRFANAIFEPIWNRRYIDYVSITAAETVGVGHRAGYYDVAGVLRDMFQNHMMQLLSMSAMEPPPSFGAERVRDEKVKVFRAMRPFPVERLDDYLVLGQYGPGTLNGVEVPGYRQEAGVAPGSVTPTFALMKIFLDNWRWQGVPFYLISGKRLPQKSTKIVIGFKRVPHSMFRHVLPDDVTANQLTIGIQPEEAITLTFQTKNPGAVVCLRTVRMEFDYLQGYTGPVLDAYEKALLDCMQGDHMLFWRQDGVELTWSFMVPVLQACEQCTHPEARLKTYASGTWGPPETEGFIKTGIWGS